MLRFEVEGVTVKTCLSIVDVSVCNPLNRFFIIRTTFYIISYKGDMNFDCLLNKKVP